MNSEKQLLLSATSKFDITLINLLTNIRFDCSETYKYSMIKTLLVDWHYILSELWIYCCGSRINLEMEKLISKSVHAYDTVDIMIEIMEKLNICSMTILKSEWNHLKTVIYAVDNLCDDCAKLYLAWATD